MEYWIYGNRASHSIGYLFGGPRSNSTSGLAQMNIFLVAVAASAVIASVVVVFKFANRKLFQSLLLLMTFPVRLLPSQVYGFLIAATWTGTAVAILTRRRINSDRSGQSKL